MNRNFLIILIILLLSIFIIVGCTNSSSSVKILEKDNDVQNHVEFQTKDISLSNEQFKNFEQYANTGNEQLLKNLTPMEIFQYYYYAFQIEDMKTLYGLYVKGDIYGTPNWKEFQQKINQTDMNYLIELRDLQERIESFSQIKYDDKTSYIQINFKEDRNGKKESSWNFKLLKNSQGIWKMDWIPFE
ncbi:hypothetical protein [Garciella nitratireducens]|uniref:DUF4829 domain-containing protein n=1 Tax=Garciella nitratireducens DSM 15102 TaxID=1121911 RepID=A0A1T4ND39_9FIRM|nr:hypothetical protein [Garciella nitratireducens]SJZ76698.1 hypothetical protein SAMN02745973_01629 [Garciella nitratireducens DSM 15102]